MFNLRNPFIQQTLRTARQCATRNFSKTVPLTTKFESQKPQEWETAKRFSEIPGLKSYPIIGNAWEFIFGRYRNLQMLEFVAQLSAEFGNICKLEGIFGRHITVMLFNPADMALVYRTEGSAPYRKETESLTFYRKKYHQELFGKCLGVSQSQGDDWSDIRSKVNPVLTMPGVEKLYISPIQEVADDFIARIISLRDENDEMPDDFWNELNKWSLETIARITLDTRIDFSKDGFHGKSDPQKLIESVLNSFELAYQLEVMPSFWKYVSTPAFRRIMNTYDTITEITSKYVDAAAAKISVTDKSSRPESVLEKLLKVDDAVAKVMTMDLIMGGVDTISSSIAHFLYHIAKNQSAQNKLREELRAAFPVGDSSIERQTLDRIPYLKACMNESARLSPITPGNLRKTGQDLVLSGYQVPKGTDVVLCHSVPQLFEAQYPFAYEFVPERWLSKEKGQCIKLEGRDDVCIIANAKDAHPFTHMPFGYGPRMCIGKRFAELEMEIFLIQFLKNYRVEWYHGEIEYKFSLLNIPANPLKFKVTQVD